MNKYICYYKNETTEIEANSQYEAYKKAHLFWKVPKNKHHMVSVLLANIVHNPNIV